MGGRVGGWGLGRSTTSKKPAMKKPSAADEAEDEKLVLATQLAGGDTELANKALSLKQSERNRWQDQLDSKTCTEEMKNEWQAVSNLGNGRNKKLRPGLTSQTPLIVVLKGPYVYSKMVPPPSVLPTSLP